jgi:hypothetical protein
MALLFVPGERIASAYKGIGFERHHYPQMAVALLVGVWMACLAFVA